MYSDDENSDDEESSAFEEEYSQTLPDPVKEDEKRRLRKRHELLSKPRNNFTLEEAIPGLREGCLISRCYKKMTTPFEHKRYWISLQDSNGMMWDLCFDHDADKMKLETSFVKSEEDFIEETSKEVTTEILKRIQDVLPATNFSYCLRNNEHMTRFIMEGLWISEQMSLTQNGPMRKYFEDILGIKDNRLMASVPSDLKEKEKEDKDEESDMSGPLIKSLRGMADFDTVVQGEGFPLSEDAYNIVIIGPTGVGKSTLTNVLFNRKVVETREVRAAAVTRDFQVVQGTMACKGGPSVDVNVVDTMGLCDNFVNDEEAVENLYQYFLESNCKIDRVVVVLAGFIKPEHTKLIKQILGRLSYEDNKDFFYFFYNKAEKMEERKKMTELKRMGQLLEVDVGHKIAVQVPDRGALTTEKMIKAGQATGINLERPTDPVSKKTMETIKLGILPHDPDILMSNKRLDIN